MLHSLPSLLRRLHPISTRAFPLLTRSSLSGTAPAPLGWLFLRLRLFLCLPSLLLRALRVIICLSLAFIAFVALRGVRLLLRWSFLGLVLGAGLILIVTALRFVFFPYLCGLSRAIGLNCVWRVGRRGDEYLPCCHLALSAAIFVGLCLDFCHDNEKGRTG